VILGRAGGRATASDVTIFKSLGMAVEDVVAADLVLSRAIELGSGAELVL
jgi:ornithine cyclodeaminase